MNDKNLFKLVKKVADMAYDYASPETGMSGNWLQDRRDEGVNAFCNQTSQGLFFELYYGQPGSIWTPWGKWNCWGSGSGDWKEVMPQLLERLGAVEVEPVRLTNMGEFGPVYAIMHVDGVALPEAILRERDEFLEYEVANEAWKKAQPNWFVRFFVWLKSIIRIN